MVVTGTLCVPRGELSDWSSLIGPRVRADCWRPPNQVRTHVELIKRVTSMTQRTEWLNDTSLLRQGEKGQKKRRRRGWWRSKEKVKDKLAGGEGQHGESGRRTRRRRRGRENGKEEHLAWPSYQGRLVSVGDFLLCFCCGCSAPLWCKWRQHVWLARRERGWFISVLWSGLLYSATSLCGKSWKRGLKQHTHTLCLCVPV